MPAMNLAARLLRRAYGMFTRVFPRCSVISQAIAFNLFLAFFPALLIAVALATSRIGGRTSLFDLIADLTQFLPPGSQAIVSEFLVKRGPEAWKVAAVGWTGTLLAGSQVMKLVMQGIHTIYGDTDELGFLHRQVRGLMLLLVTIAPLLGAAILGDGSVALIVDVAALIAQAIRDNTTVAAPLPGPVENRRLSNAA